MTDISAVDNVCCLLCRIYKGSLEVGEVCTRLICGYLAEMALRVKDGMIDAPFLSTIITNQAGFGKRQFAAAQERCHIFPACRRPRFSMIKAG